MDAVVYCLETLCFNYTRFAKNGKSKACVTKRAERVEAVSQAVRNDFIYRKL